MKISGFGIFFATSLTIAFLIFFGNDVKKSGERLAKLCATYTKGVSFLEADEKARAEQLGLTFNKVAGGTAGKYQVNILSAGMEPAICEVQVENNQVVFAK